MKNWFVISLLILMFGTTLVAQQQMSFNDGWNFKLSEDNESKLVVLPHHYNKDAFETADYYRGEATYTKQFVLANNEGLDQYLYFEGVNSLATVIINGEQLYTHKGGYTGFYVNITPALKYNNVNTVEVIVDNVNNNIPPLSGDFTIFGGIYRPVWLLTKNKVHFNIDEFGSKSILFTSENVSSVKADALLDISINNNTASKNRVAVEITLNDPSGNPVYTKTLKRTLTAGVSNFEHKLPSVKNPKLWSPDTPNLYQLQVTILDADNNTLDVFKDKLGFRSIAIDNNNALLLNGEPLKLMGASRHQDRADLGIALSDQQHYDDVKMIKDMGCNFIRLAHYPQSKAVLDACDELGLLVWEEIPVVDLVNDNDEFKANAKSALKEMVYQHFNHPSIIMWGYMNEAIIQVPYRIKEEDARTAQYNATVDLAKELDALTKKIDPSRYTVMAYHGTQLYNEIGLSEVADISGWNLYDGWYGNVVNDFEAFVYNEHQKYPNRPLIISEFGAGSDKRIHSLKPRKFDFSIEYQQEFMEHYWPVINDTSYIMGGAMWNFIDFSSAARQESMPRINNKGLLYANREFKDVYFYHKAFLSNDEPVIHIATRDWADRRLLESDSIQLIKIYSNLDKLNLYINDEWVGEKEVTNFSATWELPLSQGKYKVTSSGSWNDSEVEEDVTYLNIAYQNRDIAEDKKLAIHINAGSDAYFHQDASSLVFMPDVAYQKGSWGFVGGKPLELGDRVGTTSEIKGTNNDPLFQTQRQGEFTYKFDIEPGEYELTLYFADLNSFGEPLVYDLGATVDTDSENNTMDILVNGMVIEKELSPSDIVGGRHNLTRTYLINTDSHTIEIQFNSVQSLPFVNGISLTTK